MTFKLSLAHSTQVLWAALSLSHFPAQGCISLQTFTWVLQFFLPHQSIVPLFLYSEVCSSSNHVYASKYTSPHVHKSCITHRHLFRHMVQAFQAYRHLLTCNVSHHCVNDLSQKIPVTIPSVEKILYDIVHLETILHSWCTFPCNSLVTAPCSFNFSKEELLWGSKKLPALLVFSSWVEGKMSGLILLSSLGQGSHWCQ